MDWLWLADLEEESALLVGGGNDLHAHRLRLDARTLAWLNNPAHAQPNHRGRRTFDGVPATLAP